MRGEIFLEKFGLIDQKYIEESEEKKKNIRAPILIAACLVLVLLIAALPFFKQDEAVVPPLDTEALTEEADINYTPYTVYDGMPYSDLNISGTGYEAGILDIPGGSADIAAFDENDIDDDMAVIEGTVKDVRLKRYDIITDFDKFGDGGGTHFIEYSVVYELEVEKVYKGDITKEGETFILEDRVIAPRNTFYLKEDHRYVIPVTETGEHWGYWHGNIVEGSTERDSMYYNPYRYHPQIERTEDGYYLFSDDWETLASSEKAVRVTMDIPFDYGYQIYFNDRMMLIDGESFKELLEKILTN